MFNHTCPLCKRQFQSERYKSKFCSVRCKDLGKKKFKTCLFCGKDFCNWRNRVYCSEGCQMNHKRTDEFKYDRFLNNFNKHVQRKQDGCWNWIGPKSTQGYGNIFYKKAMPASRASWLIHNGPIPGDMHVLHKCDNPPCTNPDHLFLGTVKDNMADMMSKGRGNKKKGSEIGNSILKEHQVSEIRERLNNKENPRCIASIYGISRRTVSAIKTRKIWHHI